MIHTHHSGLQVIPVELLYEIQLYALSPHIPYISRVFFKLFKESPISFRVQYLLTSCTSNTPAPIHAADILSKVLRYPLCTPLVLDQLHSRLEEVLSRLNDPSIILHNPASMRSTCELPRRLFRSLASLKDEHDWGMMDASLSFLRHILGKGESFPKLDPNSHQGYALTRAVHARHMPLVHFLLDLGASPACKGGMAIKVAIKQRNLEMVKTLVERDDQDAIGQQTGRRGKRRRMEDRVDVDQSMLKLAVNCNARDIIEYLTWEKGVTPDMQTLRSLRL